jgi:hypothetical protein
MGNNTTVSSRPVSAPRATSTGGAKSSSHTGHTARGNPSGPIHVATSKGRLQQLRERFHLRDRPVPPAYTPAVHVYGGNNDWLFTYLMISSLNHHDGDHGYARDATPHGLDLEEKREVTQGLLDRFKSATGDDKVKVAKDLLDIMGVAEAVTKPFARKDLEDVTYRSGFLWLDVHESGKGFVAACDQVVALKDELRDLVPQEPEQKGFERKARSDTTERLGGEGKGAVAPSAASDELWASSGVDALDAADTDEPELPDAS